MPLIKYRDHERAEAIGARVFGSMDGTISTLAVVAGVAGATTDNFIVLVAGVAAMVAEAISMGFSSYSSARVRERIFDGDNPKRIKKDIKEGLTFWLMTMGGGAIPIIPFLFDLGDTLVGLRYAVILSMVFLFAVGFFTGKVTRRNPFYEGLFNATIGIIAAAATYFVGYGIALLAA